MAVIYFLTMAVNHLPPYSPELNPAERLWNVLRRDYFANRVFDPLQKASAQAERDLGEMASHRSALGTDSHYQFSYCKQGRAGGLS
ncbi:MAG: transposase [Leptospirillum sp.]